MGILNRNTKIGDIFSVNLGNGNLKYFQLIAFDLTQLNSDVIRCFKKDYPIDQISNFDMILNDEIQFYVHCVTKIGLKMKFWEKVGSSKNIGEINQIIFRDTPDYGVKLGEEPVKFTKNWFIWRVNDEKFTDVISSSEDLKNSHIGMVINPLGIIEMLKGNKYPINYPEIG